jgi:hypothetical protein
MRSVLFLGFYTAWNSIFLAKFRDNTPVPNLTANQQTNTFFLGWTSLEDEADMLSLNFGKGITNLRCVTSQKSAISNQCLWSSFLYTFLVSDYHEVKLRVFISNDVVILSQNYEMSCIINLTSYRNIKYIEVSLFKVQRDLFDYKRLSRLTLALLRCNVQWNSYNITMDFTKLLVARRPIFLPL